MTDQCKSCGGFCRGPCERDDAVSSALQHAQRRANEYGEPMAVYGYENGVISVMRLGSLGGREPLEVVRPCASPDCHLPST